MNNTETLDMYDQKRDEQVLVLHACQEKHQVKSCMGCEHFIGCEVRKTYVGAVYDSMSKGATGGFEF